MLNKQKSALRKGLFSPYTARVLHNTAFMLDCVQLMQQRRKKRGSFPQKRGRAGREKRTDDERAQEFVLTAHKERERETGLFPSFESSQKG